MIKLRLVFFALFMTSCLNAQDPVFTQYNSAPLYLNPGFAGSTGHARAATSFRDQWPMLYGDFITTNVSYDQYFAKLHGGLGLNFQNDLAASVINTTTVDLSYAFHLPLFENKLVICPAVSVGYLRKHVDLQTLNFGDMIDPRRGFVYNPSAIAPMQTTINRFDLSTGFIAYTKRLTVGFAVAHLTQPDIGFVGESHLQTRYSIHASGVIGHLPGDFENRFSIIPQAVFVQHGDFNQLTGGASVLFKNYSLGLAYRVNDAAILMAGYQNRLFRASYSYDYTVSELTNQTGGSHEVSVQFFLFRKMKPENFLAPASTVF
ncbi:MAG: PorP/SprF family type IX secretion system membrane protein [Bacteroidota bacterium]|nr:PorP/SprF family type IX secretion system membrane protein [Bacteroidota bacterium]